MAAHGTTSRALALGVAAALLTVACGESRYDDALNPRAVRRVESAFAVDPAFADASRRVANTPLAGMRGTAPALSVADDFRTQVLAVDSGVTEFSGAAEGYDAVMLLGLAAEEARDDAPARIADRVVDVTKVGKQCTDYHTCRHLIESRVDVDYLGRSGGIQMQPNGEPAEAGFGTIEITSSGALRTGAITPAQSPRSQAPVPLIDVNAPPAGDGVLRVGMLLPAAGPLGDVARAAQAGVRAAVQEINDVGGVLGTPIELLDDDTGDGSATAVTAAVERLVNAKVDAVVGGTTFDIDTVAVPRLTAAGILTISPTDTNRAMSILPDRGLYFRLAPPEDLEAQVLGTLVANDGYTRVAIVTSGAASELDTAGDISAALGAAGGKVDATIDSAQAGSAAAAADRVVASEAQAVVFTGSDTAAAPVIRALIDRGKGPSALGIYGTTTNMTAHLVELVGTK